MKLLFIGPYRDGSGWSLAALDTIKAIMTIPEIDLAIRPIKGNSHEAHIWPELEDLEQKSSMGCDCILHYMPPDNVQYSKKFKKNISYFLYETDDCSLSHWPERLNLMDEIWVPSNFVKEVAIKSGVTKPVKVVPIPCDTEKYLCKYTPHEQIIKERNCDFLFYLIGDFNRRKNVTALIKAFHSEFSKNEPVNLVLKFSKTQTNEEQYKKDTRQYVNEIKAGLKLYASPEWYKEEIILPSSYIPEYEIYSIHKTCDVYCSPHFGEGWGQTIIDAMGFGRSPIFTNWSTPAEYITSEEGWPTNYHLEPVFGMQQFPANLYYGTENWASINIRHLQLNMREAFENSELRKKKSEAGINKIFNLSYENIGKGIKEILWH